MAHALLSLILCPHNPGSCTSAQYAFDCSCNPLDYKQGIAIVAGLPKRWRTEFQWFQWQLEEIGKKKTRWINPFKRLPVQSTTPQPSLQELCLTTSCSANSTRACGNIPELNYPKHCKTFPALLPALPLLQLKPILTLLAEGARMHRATPCVYLATCFVSAQSPLQATSFSLSFTSVVFCTSFCTSLGFSQLSHVLPEVWELSLRNWEGEMERLPHVCCPSEEAPQESCWISASLGFCCAPNTTVLHLFPHGRSLANCSSSCIWEIDFNSPARECNILITSVDKVCCSHPDLDLRDK